MKRSLNYSMIENYEMKKPKVQSFYVSVNLIPQEILLQQLSFYLGIEDMLNLSQTCHIYKDLCLHQAEAYWRKFVFSYDSNTTRKSELLLRAIGRQVGPLIKEVVLTKWPKNMLSEDTLINFAKQCSFVSKVNLSQTKNVTDNVVSAFVNSSSSQLTKIEVKYCNLVTDACLVDMFSNCKKLASLSVRGCRLITGDGIASSLSNSCSSNQLINLDLASCPKVGNVALLAIAANCSELQQFSIGGSGRILPDGVLALSENCPALVSLDLSTCNPLVGSMSRLDDATFVSSTKKWPRLQSLSIKGHSHLSSMSLMHLPKTLTKLDLGGCRGITHNPFLLSCGLRRFSHLEQLSLWLAGSVVTNEIVKEFASETYMPRLTQIDLEGCAATLAM